MSAIAVDLSKTPGAMQRTLSRELPDGSVVDFAEAPAGWLTKSGAPRKTGYRAYHYTPVGGKRVRLPSTTTLLDAVLPKPGLPVWAEARGIEGLLTAIHAGQVDPARLTGPEAVDAVRRLQLGAEAAKKLAAERGLNVHAINERFMLTGEHPKLSDHPEHHRGYIRAWANCMLALDLEPVEVETLIVHPEKGYAGRLDLRARVRKAGGRLETIDYKTQERAAIYPGAHYQVGLYEEGAIRCGAEPAEGKRVIVLAADGEWDHMAADHHDWQLDAALAHYRGVKPISGACDTRNRRERDARREAA